MGEWHSCAAPHYCSHRSPFPRIHKVCNSPRRHFVSFCSVQFWEFSSPFFIRLPGRVAAAASRYFLKWLFVRLASLRYVLRWISTCWHTPTVPPSHRPTYCVWTELNCLADDFMCTRDVGNSCGIDISGAHKCIYSLLHEHGKRCKLVRGEWHLLSALHNRQWWRFRVGEIVFSMEIILSSFVQLNRSQRNQKCRVEMATRATTREYITVCVRMQST